MWQQFIFLKKDLKRWRCKNAEDFFYTIFEPGVWVVIFYRFTRALFLVNIPVLKIVIRCFCFLVSKVYEVLGIMLRPSTDVGPGLYIGHTGLIIIHPEVKIGANLTIAHGVTIGAKGLGEEGIPVIGDNVFIGSGAKVLGKISIGNNVRIGANAVVITDIPDNATVVGVPGKVVKISQGL